MGSGVDAEVMAIAAEQLGLVGRAQLITVGCSASDLRRLKRHGMEAVTSQVFAMPGSPGSWERDVRVAVMSIGGSVRASGPTAAALFGFEGFEKRGTVHVLVPRLQRVPPAAIPGGVIVHTTTSLPLIDCAVVAGLPVTSASRTILELARSGIDEKLLGMAIDHAVRDGTSSPIFLAKRLQDRRGRGHHGAPLVAALLPDSGGHSFLERRFLGLVRRAGIPRPECQRVLARDGRTIARVDFLFTDATAVVEVSGRTGHAEDGDRQHDAQRRNELQDLGLKVFEYTYRDVTTRPEYVVSTLRERLGLPPSP